MMALDDVLQAYAAIWTEADAGRRQALMAQSLAPDAVVIGPGYLFQGYQAISQEVERFMSQDPGARPVLTSGIAHHHRWARFAIAMLDASGRQVLEGEDIIEFGADGRIVRVITFWGALPPPPATWPVALRAA
jgi:hypothetical protein